MKLILAIALVTFLAVFGTRAIGKRIPLTRHIQIPGRDLFILLGILIGPHFINLLNDEARVQLQPVIVIGLGWIGFLFGMNLEKRLLKRLDSGILEFTIGQSLVTFVVLLLGAHWLLSTFWQGGLPDAGLWAAAVTLAACGAGTAQGALLRLRSESWFRGSTARAIQISSTLDDLPALIAVALSAAYLHSYAATANRLLTSLNWLAVQIVLGAAFGYLLKALMQVSRQRDVHLLIVLGAIGLAGGIAGVLDLSPLFVCAIAGATFTNFARRESTVFPILRSSEFTIYVLFLVLVGCQWRPEIAGLLPLTIGFLLLRFIGKLGGGFLFNRSALSESQAPLIGLAMLPQGGMAIALVVDFSRFHPSNLSDTLITIVIISMFAFGIVSTPLIRSIVKRRQP